MPPAMGHVYDWAKQRGYWLKSWTCGGGDDARGGEPTHLLLDGGKWHVPPESHGALLNAYAASLARWPKRMPCVVEVRTPVFKMFADVDARFVSDDDAKRVHDGSAELGEVVRRMNRVLASVTPPEEPPPRALVCCADRVKRETSGVFKLGVHVVWPRVLVTTATALDLRRRFIEALGDDDLAARLGLANAWDTVVDASVYTSSGLRMPWSAKGRDDDRYYELRFVAENEDAMEPRTAGTLTAVREALHELSIRVVHTARPTLSLSQSSQPSSSSSSSSSWVSKSLAAYAGVLADLDRVLPPQFVGQRFCGLLASEHSVMLRSTSRFCFNLGRTHNSNNVYFVLTRRGVCQRCFCRCETTDGRKQGLCRDFSSEWWPVPESVVTTFFPDAAIDDDKAKARVPLSHSAAPVSKMPSDARKFSLGKFEAPGSLTTTTTAKRAGSLTTTTTTAKRAGSLTTTTTTAKRGRSSGGGNGGGGRRTMMRRA